MSSTSAIPIGEPARFVGPADSVESLLRQVASLLLGSGASERTLKSARLSPSAALRAMRMRPREGFGPWLANTLREEGRLFLLNRDTVRALQSNQHFLELRADAQPPYVAERDSVKAIVSRLKTRFTP